MDLFCIIYEVDGVKSWVNVLANNTMHAKEKLYSDFPGTNVIILSVDFADDSGIECEDL